MIAKTAFYNYQFKNDVDSKSKWGEIQQLISELQLMSMN